MRYFFEITYEGTRYHGWQSQDNATGVQKIVEDALSKILRQRIPITGSSRTDTGVHCVQQFFHADIPAPFDKALLVQRLNSFLPKDIAIRSVRAVKNSASARYDANSRTYQYFIVRKKDPFRELNAYRYHKELNIPTLKKAAALLVGTHDFQSFSKVKTDVDHYNCTIRTATWNQKGDLLVFTVAANRFLRGMVRALVGTQLDAGTGKITLDDMRIILKSRDRRKAGMNVPAKGLFLMRVTYPSGIFVKEKRK